MSIDQKKDPADPVLEELHPTRTMAVLRDWCRLSGRKKPSRTDLYT